MGSVLACSKTAYATQFGPVPCCKARSDTGKYPINSLINLISGNTLQAGGQ